jgi:hypothetical protein
LAFFFSFYHSPPSSAEVNYAWGFTSTPPERIHDVVDNFTFTPVQHDLGNRKFAGQRITGDKYSAVEYTD